MTDTTVALQALLVNLRDGNEAARRELLTRAYARLEKMVRGKLRTFARPAETGDVLHDVWLRLDRALKEVRPETPRQFFALASQHIRWVLLNAAGARRGAELPDIADSTPGPSTEAGRDDQFVQIHKAVESLEEPLREVVELLVYHGLTQIEAAEVLGVSDRTVKKRWRDARLKLYEALGSEIDFQAGLDPGGAA